MKKYLIIDTETTNSLEEPLCYDVGMAIIDKQGNVYESYNFIVSEIFLDRELMEVAYFAEKIPQYWVDIQNGTRKLTNFNTIRKTVKEVCRKYNIKIVIAHNAKFDEKSLRLTQRFITSSKYKYFLPYGVEFWDTLRMAREVLGKCEDYANFCQKNNYFTKTGQKRMTAEILYRFISGDNEFIESHTGLEDVLIEKEIFRYCIEKKPNINGKLWQKEDYKKVTYTPFHRLIQ